MAICDPICILEDSLVLGLHIVNLIGFAPEPNNPHLGLHLGQVITIGIRSGRSVWIFVGDGILLGYDVQSAVTFGVHASYVFVYFLLGGK